MYEEEALSEPKRLMIFIISPVRNISDSEKIILTDIVKRAELEGHSVYWPLRNTDQTDNIGYAICRQNIKAMESCDEVWIWWNPESEGSVFDLGVLLCLKEYLHIPVKLLNQPIATKGKSFSNIILRLTGYI